MADRFSADPTVVFMTAVLDDIATGKLLIPRFQRPLVWKWEQRRDLLGSIYEGLPVGALMLWVSDGEAIGTYESLGPHRLPKPASGSENRYLMDGVQRVSTLYGALRAERSWEEFDDSAGAAIQDFVVYADLDAQREQDRFVREMDIRALDRLMDPTRYMPLNVMLDTKDFIRFQRSIPPEHEARMDVADGIAGAFREYKVPLITLKSASLEVVTKSFQRVNSRGADMSELHMLNALSYSSSFDLLSHDRNLRERLLAPQGWGKIDQDVVLRCLKLRLGADLYTTNPDEISEQLKSDPTVVDEVFAGLSRSAEFLSERLNIHRPELVPYRMQLVGLARVLFNREWREIAQELTDWFWISTYTEAFGSSARQSENALADLDSYIRTGQFRWSLREVPTVRSLRDLRVDFRAARVKALALALARRRAEHQPSAREPVPFGPDSFAQVVFDEALRGRAGFRFQLAPAEAQQFRQALAERILTQDERSAHLISENAAAYASHGAWGPFVELREQDILAYELSHIVAPAAGRMNLPIANAERPDIVAPVFADLFSDF
ncbi:MAG: DUF262 domain-containing protein [Alphaproteobacteria bacterium]|nr:MAG: DUF262 domain-containing protein [Alphaproteobacteria bacterium]